MQSSGVKWCLWCKDSNGFQQVCSNKVFKVAILEQYYVLIIFIIHGEKGTMEEACMSRSCKTTSSKSVILVKTLV